MSVTEEGYLRGTAIVTRTGVFTYVNSDGSLRKELRHPDDILEEESLSSLQMVPVTVDHPRDLVNSDNAKELAVGHTGESVSLDGEYVMSSVIVTHKDGIDAVRGGKNELSMGYTLDLEEETGSYLGENYTHRQRRVRYNHLAIVDVARAGRAARLNLDGASVQVVETDQTEKTMIKVNIDGIQYDAAPEVARHIEKQAARVDSLTKDAETEKARADKAEARADELDAKFKESENKRKDTSEMDKRVQARIDLMSKAAKVPGVNADDFQGLSDRDVMIKAVQARHSGTNLDGKSDDYVQARFDSVIEDLEEAAPGGTERIAPKPSKTQNSDAKSEEEAFGKSVMNLNAWRNA